MAFQIHPKLKAKEYIVDLPTCRVLLENNRHYPWLILVPRIENISKLMDLAWEDKASIIKEAESAEMILWELFQPTQMNVAAIGNKTPQLHIHVIARDASDPAWPGVVWDHPVKESYAEEELAKLKSTLQTKFAEKFHIEMAQGS